MLRQLSSLESRWWCSYEQFPHAVQADILGIDIARAKNLETTALRAPSWFVSGLLGDLDELKLLNETGELFEPSYERIAQGTTLQRAGRRL